MEFSFDATGHRYSSRRSLVYGRRGMVASSQPLASEAGIEILRKGGNAFDAVIAAAAALTVVEPMSDPLGGDAFAVLWHDGKLYGMNASGPAPDLLTPAALRERGYTSMPEVGWGSVTVPGMIAGWADLSRKFGRLPLSEVLRPAIEYAEQGFPVAPTVQRLWRRLYSIHKVKDDPEFYAVLEKLYAPKGHLPKAGDIVKFPEIAETLREIGETGGESFYRGRLAEKMAEYSESTGGFLRKDDLAAYATEWIDPISVNYKGYDVWELPPNGHGIVVLMALQILKEMDLTGGHDDPEVMHRQIEAMKLAFTDGKRYVTDPRYMKASIEKMLSDSYAAERRSLIGDTAMLPKPGSPFCGNTVYLNAADGEGNMISWIQSGYINYGSGVTVPGTGIVFQNRASNFTMDETKENCVAPGKKPYHTIIPGFLTKDGKAVGPFGVMGGFMQPQGHVQILNNMIDFGMNPQEALDAPRWMWTGEKKITLETGISLSTAQALFAKGHEITFDVHSLNMGRGQIIFRNDEGVLCGASEPRTDGYAAAF